MLVLIPLCYSINLWAQNYKTFSVSGQVLDESGEPLPYTHVVIESLNKGVMSDTRGVFHLSNLPPGKYRLTAQMMGFENQVKILTLQNKSVTGVYFILKESVHALEEVIVSAETPGKKLEKTAEAIKVLETIEVKLQTADMGEIMAKTEGVSVRRNGGLGSGAQFALNGLTGDQIRFFLDGIPLEFSPYSFGFANIPVNKIARVEIFKGVVPIRLGADALGGAVNLVTPDMRYGLSGSASYQTGYFGTHRVSANLNYVVDRTGLFVSGGGFYDFAENNYKVDVEIADEKGRLQQVTVPRFHDSYKAQGGNITLGIKNVKWADELSIKGFYTDSNKDIQHNNIMAGIPYGDVKSSRKSAGTNLTYQNSFVQKFNLELLAGYTYSERQFIDTGHCAYNWHGECILVKNQGGEIGGMSHQFTWDNNFFTRLNAEWNINQHHSLKLSAAPTLTLRTGDEFFAGTYDPLTARGRLFSWVNGLEYTMDALNDRLQATAFAKTYTQQMEAEKDVPSNAEPILTERNTTLYGYGSGLRYMLSDRLRTKLNYEYAIRIPRQDEVFGDGQFILKSLELKPERSHNANLELKYTQPASARSKWFVQSNIFLRKTQDLILLIPATDRTNIYQNVFEANSTGVELSGGWADNSNRLDITFNTTYQEYYNNSDEGAFEAFKGDRIPNTPYLFANNSIRYAVMDNKFQKNDQLSVFLTGRYVHEFFRSWESAGLIQFKKVIPSQFVQNAGLTYKLPTKTIRWALTAEVQNLSNAKVFDFLGVQKPGRAFYIKLTTQF